MNTSTIARITSARWFRASIVVAGALLIAGAAVSGLLGWATISTVPSAPARSVNLLLTAAHQRYEDFKLRQVEQVVATAPRAVVATAVQMRYAEFKRHQVERVEAKFGGIASVVSAAHEGFEDFKRRQIEQIDVGVR